MTPYEPENYDRLLGTPGFSNQLLKNHFTLYQGYVKNTNKLRETLDALVKGGKASTPEFAEMKRRLGWEFNGMRLHEYYFENMSKTPERINPHSELPQKISEDFGSFENWEKDFKATGAMRGTGWAALYLDPLKGKLLNVWINEHDMGHLAGCTPLLIMDVFEHAFMMDYGLKREDYIEAFFKSIDWETVSSRFETSFKELAVTSSHREG